MHLKFALSKFFVPLQLKFFEAVQDAAVAAAAEAPPRCGGLKQQRRGRGLAVLEAVYRGDAGKGNGERAKVLRGQQQTRNVTKPETERSKRNGERGTGNGNGCSLI